MNAAYLISLLPFLACPLGMGLMGWLVMRMQKHEDMPATHDQSAPAHVAPASPVAQLGALRAQLGEVEAQQAALAAQLGQLGHAQVSAEMPIGRTPLVLADESSRTAARS